MEFTDEYSFLLSSTTQVLQEMGGMYGNGMQSLHTFFSNQLFYAVRNSAAALDSSIKGFSD